MRILLATAALSVFVIHCSSSTPAGPASSSDGGAPDGPGGGGGSGVVTPSTGGTIKSGDGRVTIEVPPGAVSGDTTITIAPSTRYPDDAQVLPGTVYDFGPDGIVFSAPVTMTIAYDASQIRPGLAEADLRIQKAGAAAWSEVAGSTGDLAANVARAQVLGFSTYGVRSIRAPLVTDAGADAEPDQDAGPIEPPVGALVTAGGFAALAVGMNRIGSGQGPALAEVNLGGAVPFAFHVPPTPGYTVPLAELPRGPATVRGHFEITSPQTTLQRSRVWCTAIRDRRAA